MATYLREADWLPATLCIPLILALLAMKQLVRSAHLCAADCASKCGQQIRFWSWFLSSIWLLLV